MSTTTQPGCPFCGETECYVDDISHDTFAVICQNPDCGAIGPGTSWADAAVILWNERVNCKQIEYEVIERCAELCEQVASKCQDSSSPEYAQIHDYNWCEGDVCAEQIRAMKGLK